MHISTPPNPVFTGFSVGSAQDKKKPNRSNESKAKAAAKRSKATKAVKVWEAIEHHIEKGVGIMSNIDDIESLHCFISREEECHTTIMNIIAVTEAKVRL